MAINPNETLKSKHKVFMGTSGSGKTWKFKQMLRDSPKSNVLVFDPVAVYGDVLEYVENFKDLVRKVTRAIDNNEVFRFAYRGKPQEYNNFCELVWLSADGDKNLIFGNEEAGGYLDNSAKPSDRWYDIVTIGRKFGLVMVTVAQRPQSINKTVYDESQYAFIGHCKGRAKIYVEREFMVNIDLIGHETYNYFLSDNSGVVLMDKNDKPIKLPKKTPKK